MKPNFNQGASASGGWRVPFTLLKGALGKRSVALGQGLKTNTSLFSKLGWQGQPNFEKREISGGGGLPPRREHAASEPKTAV